MAARFFLRRPGELIVDEFMRQVRQQHKDPG
jgi:hypothetical protein